MADRAATTMPLVIASLHAAGTLLHAVVTGRRHGEAEATARLAEDLEAATIVAVEAVAATAVAEAAEEITAAVVAARAEAETEVVRMAEAAATVAAEVTGSLANAAIASSVTKSRRRGARTLETLERNKRERNSRCDPVFH